MPGGQPRPAVPTQNFTLLRQLSCKLVLRHRSDEARLIARDGSAPAVQVPECAPLEFVSATIFGYEITAKAQAAHGATKES